MTTAAISRFRFCSKHTKPKPQPLPCKFCGSAPKPAQVPPAPEPQVIPCAAGNCGEAYFVPSGTTVSKDFRYVCAKHTPALKRADAKGVPRSAVPPEVSRQIKQQLATAPREPRSLAAVVEVETSEGLETVKASQGIEATDIADDAASNINRGKKNKKKITRAPAKPKKQSSGAVVRNYSFDRPKQPSYLKSVAQPVIPLLNEDGTVKGYGLDDNGKPIMPGRSDQELATALLEKTFLTPGQCPHKGNPKYCLLCGTANYQTIDAKPISGQGYFLILEALQRRFGLASVATPVKKFDYFPEILGITRGQLVGLLDLRAAVEPRPVKKKALKSRAVIDQQIAELLRIPKQIEKRKQLIHKSEELIESWQKRVMKLRRAEDDILDKPTREKYKRKERARIFRCKDKIAELRKRVSGLDELQQRVATSFGFSQRINHAVKHRQVYLNSGTYNGTRTESRSGGARCAAKGLLVYSF